MKRFLSTLAIAAFSFVVLASPAHATYPQAHSNSTSGAASNVKNESTNNNANSAGAVGGGGGGATSNLFNVPGGSINPGNAPAFSAAFCTTSEYSHTGWNINIFFLGGGSYNHHGSSGPNMECVREVTLAAQLNAGAESSPQVVNYIYSAPEQRTEVKVDHSPAPVKVPVPVNPFKPNKPRVCNCGK